MSSNNKKQFPKTSWKYKSLYDALWDFDELKVMIASDEFDINERKPCGRQSTILHAVVNRCAQLTPRKLPATRKQCHKILKYLLNCKNINIHAPNIYDVTPLETAIENCSNIAELLIEHGALIIPRIERNHSPLKIAIACGHIDKAIELLKHSTQKYVTTCKWPYNDSPVHWAIQANRENLLLYLIQNGHNLNREGKYGRTPLHYAALGNNLSFVKRLVLKHHVLINIPDYFGQTPLTLSHGGSRKWLMTLHNCHKGLKRNRAFYHFQKYVYSGSRGYQSFRGLNLGDSACKAIAFALTYTKRAREYKQPFIIDLSNNPRITSIGLNALERTLNCSIHHTIHLILSEAPVSCYNKFQWLTRSKKNIEVNCPFPSLLTITSYFIAKNINSK